MANHFNRSIFLFFLVLPIVMHAQKENTTLFSAPLNVPMFLAGNFGEIRPGHFHAGIDIKTQQVEGLPVLAAADGYISRVKIALGGYGNALYITHPNGYTTVYGHLQKYNDQITEYVLKEQYAQKSFTVELYFTPEQLPVKRGDVVALSGNTGGSGGPHLHFEIRTTNGSVPQNPLKFGLPIKDNIPPIFKNLAIYPMNDTSVVNGKNQPAFIPLQSNGSGYTLAPPQNLSARGVIGFGVEVLDKLNGSDNRCGVYSVTLKADTSVIYSHQMDAISFDETRFINTHVDFYQTSKYKRRIQKSYLTSYNKLNIYSNVKNKGLVYFSKFGHDLHYTIVDAYGNESSLAFSVKLDTAKVNSVIQPDTTLSLFSFSKPNSFETSDVKISLPAYSLYEDLRFAYEMKDTVKNAVSAVHQIQNLYTPLENYITISLRTKDVSPEEGAKFYAASLNGKNAIISPEGGKYENGWLTFSTRSFGPYAIFSDTYPPQITAVNFKTSDPSVKHLHKLLFRATDGQSGIETYNAYVDGEWTLLEFDKKSGLLWIDFTKYKPSAGAHQLQVTVGDAVNNFKTFTFDFIW